METLASGRCEACRADSPRLTPAERDELLPQVPDWQLRVDDGVEKLERVFRFANFAQAMEFSVKVGAMADQEDHHPALLTEWGRVTVTWWTHKIRGLHRNDFIAAAKTDQLF